LVSSGDPLLSTKGSKDGIYDIRFSSDFSLLAYTNIKSISLFAREKGRVVASLEGHENVVRSIAFNKWKDILCSGMKGRRGKEKGIKGYGILVWKNMVIF
jgi:WD40 repeat protein